MCAIPQLVSPVLNPIPIVEHFSRSHAQCEHMQYSYRQCIWVERVVLTMRPMMPVATVSASTSLTCGRCIFFTKTISKMPTKRIVFTYQKQNSLIESLKSPLTFGSREKLWIKDFRRNVAFPLSLIFLPRENSFFSLKRHSLGIHLLLAAIFFPFAYNGHRNTWHLRNSKRTFILKKKTKLKDMKCSNQMVQFFFVNSDTVIGHFTVVCSGPWPLNRSEAGGELVLLQTFLFFICKWSCPLVC